MNDITSDEVQQRLAELKSGKKKLLKSGSTNKKLSTNTIESYILNLAPAKQNSRGKQLCAGASPGCIKACLFTSGHGRFTPVQRTRMLNTEVYVQYQKEFLEVLLKELKVLNAKALKNGVQIGVRVNGTSDVPLYDQILKQTGEDVVKDFTGLLLWDYTKRYKYWKQYQGTRYHLTFSRSEVNWLQCQWVLFDEVEPGSVAVVFYPTIPDTYQGIPVFDATQNDMRWLDPKGQIAGLKYKRAVGYDPLTDPFVVKV